MTFMCMQPSDAAVQAELMCCATTWFMVSQKSACCVLTAVFDGSGFYCMVQSHIDLTYNIALHDACRDMRYVVCECRGSGI